MLFEKLIVAIKYDSMRKIVFEVYVLITEEQSIAYFHFSLWECLFRSVQRNWNGARWFE